MSQPSISQLFDLSGKVALVTGGARGIGYGIAQRLAEAGAAVMLSSVSNEGAAQAAARLVEQGWQAAGVQADAARVEDVQGSIHATVERFGRLDILVNNVGVFPVSPLTQTTEELWDRVLDINLKGAFFATQAAAQQMIAQGQGGRIINIGSVDGFRPTYAMTPYSASKAGMRLLTQSSALQLGPHQINVNLIAPGFIHTDGGEAVTNEFAALFGLQGQDTLGAYIEGLPLRRAGVPDDVARAALFLASSAADFITGTTIAVDGGQLAV